MPREAYALRREGGREPGGGAWVHRDRVRAWGPVHSFHEQPEQSLGLREPAFTRTGMEQPLFVGTDVAKDGLDVHFRPTGEAFSVPHDDAGLAGLAGRLTRLHPTLVALEATGGYEVPVAA